MEELLALFRAKASEIAKECDQGKEDRLKAAWQDLYPEYKRLSQPVRCKVCPGRTTAYDDGLVIGARWVIEKVKGFANKHPGLCPEAKTLILEELAAITLAAPAYQAAVAKGAQIPTRVATDQDASRVAQCLYQEIKAQEGTIPAAPDVDLLKKTHRLALELDEALGEKQALQQELADLVERLPAKFRRAVQALAQEA